MKATNEHIDTHALLVKYITGGANAAEKLQAEKWLGASDENRRYYEHFKQIWDESLALANTTTIDEDKAWERLRGRIHNGYIAAAIPVKNYLWLKVAAVFLLATTAILFVPYLFRHKEDVRFATIATKQKLQTTIIKPDTLIAIAINKVKTDTLPDGSVITQNKNSTLSYPATFGTKNRTVELTGEAFFNVKHDPKKPFIIKVNDVQITVLGTSFNVKSNSKTTEVIVETGMVSVQRQRQITILYPGEKLTATDTTTKFKKEPVTDKSYRNYLDEKVKMPVKDQVKKLIKKDTPTNKRLYHVKHDSIKTN